MAKRQANATAEQPAAIWVATADLALWAKNPRNNSAAITEVVKSIKRFGFGSPIVRNSRTGEVIAGHTRIAAALKIGMSPVPVRDLDLSPAEAHALALADNRLGEIATWDDAALADVLREIAAADETLLADTGFSEEDLARLLGETVAEVVPEGDDGAPAIDESKPAVSQLGEMFELGPHRLVCGDSTDADTVKRLMGGELADCVWTDPPYNIASKNKGVAANVSKSHEKLMASDWDKGFDFADVQANLLSILAKDATVYVCTSHHLAGSIWAWMKEWADHSSWCVWSKPNPMPSLMKRHWTWNSELICYATRGKHTFNFPEDGHALSTWTITRVNGDTGHPTEKPPKLPQHAIEHSSKVGDIVADLYGGSGSTLIACAQTGRIARLIEIDPRYCDVIRRRWTRWAKANGREVGSGALE